MPVRQSHGRTHVAALEPRVPTLLTLSEPLVELLLYAQCSAGLEAEILKTKNIVKYKIYSLALRYFASSWG